MTDELPVNGFLLVDKPSGMTSHQIVAQVKKTLGIHRVGHGGTLDPMATGLLIIGVGRATRLLGYIADKSKQYTATIRFGQDTVTDDAEGEPIGEKKDATAVTRQDIELAMGRYIGDINQVPSSVSAIKVMGKRAYELVREGKEVQLKSRTVNVTRFDLLSRSEVDGWVDCFVIVDCSSGTYIRALARDLGRDLGVGGHITALRRTRIGGMSIEDAISPEDFSLDKIIPMGDMAAHIAPSITIDESNVRNVAVGRSIEVELTGLTTVLFESQMLALYQPNPEDPSHAVPVAVFIDPIIHRQRPHHHHHHSVKVEPRTDDNG